MAFTEWTILKVWQKGSIVLGYDSNIWRKDDYGSLMYFVDYGDRNSQYGWEIDHIAAVSEGGSDNPWNLRPLQWENNIRRQAGYLA